MDAQGKENKTMIDYTEEVLKELRAEYKTLKEELDSVRGEMIRIGATISTGKQILTIALVVQIGLSLVNALQGRSEITIQKAGQVEQKAK